MIATTHERRPALVWRSTAARLLLAAYPLWATAGVVFLWTPWRQKMLVGGIAALTLASPSAGLVALAALTPLGAVLESVTRLPFRLSEAFVMAFLGAWLLRASGDRRGPRLPPTMAAGAWLLVVALAASVASNVWRVPDRAGQMADLGTWLLQSYYVVPDGVGFVDAARLGQSLALVAATLYLFRRRPSLAVTLPAALAVGAAVAAAASVVVWTGAGPSALVDRYTRFGYRAAHITDPNAAGSFFAVVVCLSLGMLARARGRARAGWAVLVLASALGLWFAESKSAIAAAVSAAALAAGWVFTARAKPRVRITAIAALLAIGIGATMLRAERLQSDPTYQGSGFRTQFTGATVRMIAAHPLAGVGVGRYYPTSVLFLSPQLGFAYGQENAHNYFLQTAAELGLPGLALFAVWMASAWLTIGRTIARSTDPRLVGLAAGTAALLVTCLTGHPLLVSEVAFPFYIALGLAIGLAESIHLEAEPDTAPESPLVRRRAVVACIALAIAMASTTAWSARRRLEPVDSHDIDGFYAWQTDVEGTRYRWSGLYSSLIVPNVARRVYIPVRQPFDRHAISPLGITVSINGATLYRTFVGTAWSVLDVPLPNGDPVVGFKRINLKVDHTWRPGVYVAGSSDLRDVGVQVGACRIVEWTDNVPRRDDGC